MRDRLCAAARRWADPDAPARRQAAEAFVAAEPFSEAQVAFALNEQMAALQALDLSGDASLAGLVAGLQIDTAEPLAALAEAVALLLLGARVRRPGGGACALVRAFLEDAIPGSALAGADEAVDFVLTRTDDAAEVNKAIALPLHVGVAVLDGKEDEAAREALAEDVLLMNGGSGRCVRVVWAPAGLAPDAILETFAAFRGRFPAPPTLAPRVRMMTAFAAKAGLPHAYLDDQSLLVTRGAPDAQAPGHLRWVTYDRVGEVGRWLQPTHRLYAREGFRGISGARPLGTAHRPGTARFTEAVAEIRQARARQRP